MYMIQLTKNDYNNYARGVGRGKAREKIEWEFFHCRKSKDNVSD